MLRADITALRLATIQILDRALTDNEAFHRRYGNDPHAWTWSVQGFGMLRLYIRQIGRLHIWDSALEYPNVSKVHTHSWDLKSTVVCGCVRNTRFAEEQVIGHAYKKHRLLTGYQARPVTEAVDTRLLSWPVETYFPGDVYAQHAHEIHRTDALDGTVTIMARNEDVNGEADVFWPVGCSWGTATPRQATPEEIRGSVTKALAVLEIAL